MLASSPGPSQCGKEAFGDEASQMYTVMRIECPDSLAFEVDFTKRLLVGHPLL